MALRSISMQLKNMPKKKLCYLRSALCFEPAPAPAPAPTTWDQNGDKQLRPIDQFENQQQINFCKDFYTNLSRACFKPCAVETEDRATVWYKEQNKENALVTNQKVAASENKSPNLDFKLPIRKVAPLPKEIKNISYISPEFRELLRKHDEQMMQKYILPFLPERYTKQLRKPIDDTKPYCICEELREKPAEAGDKTAVSKRRNFFKFLSCCTRGPHNDEFKECQCSKGKRGQCEMCSQRLAKKSILKKNIKKSKEKNRKVSKAKSVEIFKDERDSQNRYWVGTASDMQLYNASRREKYKQALDMQYKRQSKQKKKSAKGKSKK